MDTNDANSESTLRELRTKLDSGTSVSINGTDYLMEADSFNQEELSPMQYVNIRSLKVEQTCGKLRTEGKYNDESVHIIIYAMKLPSRWVIPNCNTIYELIYVLFN